MLLFTFSCFSQIQFSVIKGGKSIYKIGDKISLDINLKTLPETCSDGMKKAKLYVTGFDIENQTEWAQTNKGLWNKKINLIFIDNKKKIAKITIMRKVDKESLFKQMEFNMQ
jgi:hypothetical protein